MELVFAAAMFANLVYGTVLSSEQALTSLDDTVLNTVLEDLLRAIASAEPVNVTSETIKKACFLINQVSSHYVALRYSPKNEYALEKTNINLFSAFVVSVTDAVSKEQALGEALARNIHIYSEL